MAESPAQSDLEDVVIRTLTWRLVPFLFLLYVVAYLDRINVGFAALQMQRDLHFNDAVYGLGAGVFFAGYFCFQVPSNLMLRRVGARRWIAALMVTWGIISIAMMLVASAQSFYWLRFLLGAAEAGFFPGVILYLKMWFPGSARARTVARFMTAAPLAGVVGGPISGALLGLHQRWNLSGWQWLFLIEGLPAILLGVTAARYLPDRVEDAVWLEDRQRVWLVRALHREEGTPDRPDPIWGAVLDVRMWILAFVYFGVTTAMYGVSMWLPNLIHSLSGIGTLTVGLLSAIPYLAAAVAMVLVGLHSDTSGERRWHTAFPGLVAAVAFTGAAYSGSVVSAVLAITLASAGVFSMMGPFWSTPTRLLSGAGAAVGIALINSVGNLGGFFGPFAIGRIRNATGSFRGGLLLVGTAVAIGAILSLTVRDVREGSLGSSGGPA